MKKEQPLVYYDRGNLYVNKLFFITSLTALCLSLIAACNLAADVQELTEKMNSAALR